MTSITEQGRAFYDAVPHEVPDWEGSLFSLLEDAARLYPDRAALDYFGAAITYRQVLEQVERVDAFVAYAAGSGGTVAVAFTGLALLAALSRASEVAPPRRRGRHVRS